MFTTAERTGLRDRLIDRARTDPQITGAAILGSAARHEEDRWSDIDLALRLEPGRAPVEVAQAWSRWVQSLTPVTDRLDLWANGALYRVLLLESTLQVDLSFWPDHTFRAHGPDFELLFGEAEPPASRPRAEVGDQLRWAWLYLLHARSAIARRRPWQAIAMLEGVRNQVIAAACLRHGLPAHEGRGVDRLPVEQLDRLQNTVISSTGNGELRRVINALVDLLASEVDHAGLPNSAELIGTCRRIAASVE